MARCSTHAQPPRDSRAPLVGSPRVFSTDLLPRPSVRCRRIGVPHSSEHSDARVSRVSTEVVMVGSGPGLAVIVTFIVHIIEIDGLLVPSTVVPWCGGCDASEEQHLYAL